MNAMENTKGGNAVYRRFYDPIQGRADANAMAEHIADVESQLATAQRALAEAQQELEAVKAVEKWPDDRDRRILRRDGVWFAEKRSPSSFPQYEPDTWVPTVYADSLPALGRALAAHTPTEANDAQT